MGAFSIWHWIIVLVVVLVLFGGGGKLSKLMGDAGRGITAFKKGLKDEKNKPAEGEPEGEVAAQRSIADESPANESQVQESENKKASAG